MCLLLSRSGLPISSTMTALCILYMFLMGFNSEEEVIVVAPRMGIGVAILYKFSVHSTMMSPSSTLRLFSKLANK